MALIKSTRSYTFKTGNEKFDIQANLLSPYMGTVPDEVTESKLFKLAVKDGSITFIGAPPVAITKEEVKPADSKQDSKPAKPRQGA